MYHGHVPCAHCGSLETTAQFDEFCCRRCGGLTRLRPTDGPPEEPHLGAPVPPEVQFNAKNM